MTEEIDHPDELVLAGYLTAFDEGFAIPCYRTQGQSNVWYVAICSVNGDHDGAIISFELFESENIVLLPQDRNFSVKRGQLWQDVFLWNGEPYVGRPASILEAISPDFENIAVQAPLSLLDLAMAAGDNNPRPLVRAAFAHIDQRHGEKVASSWLRDTLVLEQGRLLTRRCLADSGQSQDLVRDVRYIEVHEHNGRMRVVLPDSIIAALGETDHLVHLENRIDDLVQIIPIPKEIGSNPSDTTNSVQETTAESSRRPSSFMDRRPNLLARLLDRMGFAIQSKEEIRAAKTAAETSQKMADKMRDLARTDVVTGLSNRAGLNHELVDKLMAMRDQAKLALFWLDLDRFKEVNDTLGHTMGDRVLCEVARRLRAIAPASATVARFGGDEFIVVCEVRTRDEAAQLAAQLLDEITHPIQFESDRVEIASSIGVALMPDDGVDLDTVMQSADLALYHAKIKERDPIRFFDASMTRNLMRRREIEAALRAALQRDDLSIFFQPIVDLETGRIKTFEALVRWFHPEKGEQRPDEFIPVAEESGLIVTLGNWTVTRAARACAQWPKDVTVAVNLSPVQIKAPGSALGILNALKEANLEPSRLELEVTESLFLDDSRRTARFMEELTATGVRFTLDDFGTGFSSLGYINKFPFKKIKVDRSFVSGPHVGRESDALIHAVAELGARLDMDVIAEGIETIEQLNAVCKAGCTLGQGFYFSRAVPEHLANELLTSERSASTAQHKSSSQD